MTTAALRLPAGGAVSLAAGWDRVLTANEVDRLGPGYDAVVLGHNPFGFWPMGAETPWPVTNYNQSVQDGQPFGFWKMDAESAVTWPAYNTSVLSHGPDGFWPMNSEVDP